MNSYEENEMRKVSAKVHLRRLCALRKTGARLFAQIKACAVHKVQSFALRSR
jgi:hypothetical protein